MNSRNRHLINVLSTGVLVTILTLVGLFWARWYCHLVRVTALYRGIGRVQVSPTGLFPFEKADDPNLASPSSATAQLNAVAGLFTGLGAPRYVRSYTDPGSDPHSYLYRWEPKEQGPRFYFDPSLHLMVYGGMSDVQDPNGTVRRRYVTQYAGPEGIAETPEERLGRFVSPISDGFHTNNPQTVYDEGYRRFFVIRWREGLVRKGPELKQENGYRPVQMGLLQKNLVSMSVTQRDAHVQAARTYRTATRDVQTGRPRAAAANGFVAGAGSERIGSLRPAEPGHAGVDAGCGRICRHRPRCFGTPGPSGRRMSRRTACIRSPPINAEPRRSGPTPDASQRRPLAT